MSQAEESLLWQIKVAGLPTPEREYRFCERRFRFDMAWRDRRIAAEVEGGLYIAGRHVRPAGYESDARKYNLAQLLGWRVYRFSPGMIHSGEALRTLGQALEVM